MADVNDRMPAIGGETRPNFAPQGLTATLRLPRPLIAGHDTDDADPDDRVAA